MHKIFHLDEPTFSDLTWHWCIMICMQVSTDCFKFDQDVVFQKLRDKAVVESTCGQNAVVERKVMLTPRSDITVYAIVTNVVQYSKTSKAFPDSLTTNGDLKKRIGSSINGTESSRKRSKRCKKQQR